MKILIKSATIIDSSSPFHRQTKDILLQDFQIIQVEDHIETSDAQLVEFKDLHVSQGWFDSSVSFGEPGFEERETIKNGLKSAAAGGFTSVVLNSNPVSILNSASQIDFVKTKGLHQACTLKPLGTVSKEGQGSQLAELFDMHLHGAVGFYDYQTDMSNTELLKLAIQYASDFDGLVMSFPLDSKLSKAGVMHEGVVSTSLGLPGMSSSSEISRIQRDIELLKYTGGRLHIPTISCKESVDLIKQAKAEGLKVSCSVAIDNLVLTDEALMDFDTNFKLNPPLRTSSDQKALLKGVKDGTIDLVTSNHNPLDTELKQVTFDQAAFGSVGLETSFGALQSVMSTVEAVDALTRGKSIFKIESQPIDIGSKADLCLFSPSTTYQVKAESLISKSKNSCFLGQSLKGKAHGVIANGINTITL